MLLANSSFINDLKLQDAPDQSRTTTVLTNIFFSMSVPNILLHSTIVASLN